MAFNALNRNPLHVDEDGEKLEELPKEMSKLKETYHYESTCEVIKLLVQYDVKVVLQILFIVRVHGGYAELT